MVIRNNNHTINLNLKIITIIISNIVKLVMKKIKTLNILKEIMSLIPIHNI